MSESNLCGDIGGLGSVWTNTFGVVTLSMPRLPEGFLSPCNKHTATSTAREGSAGADTADREGSTASHLRGCGYPPENSLPADRLLVPSVREIPRGARVALVRWEIIRPPPCAGRPARSLFELGLSTRPAQCCAARDR